MFCYTKKREYHREGLSVTFLECHFIVVLEVEQKYLLWSLFPSKGFSCNSICSLLAVCSFFLIAEDNNCKKVKFSSWQVIQLSRKQRFPSVGFHFFEGVFLVVHSLFFVTLTSCFIAFLTMEGLGS